VAAHLIALDWGTTSLRAYRFDAAGEVVEARELPLGIQRIAAGGAAGFERAFAQACGDWRSVGAGPIIACGMVGSAQGWREAAYLEIPASVDALGRALTEVETDGAVVHIIPGLIARGPLPDVMRGEETQVAGALAAGDAAAGPGGDAWFCLPGSHSKWVRVREGRIVELHSFLTGELFAALCEHTILGRTMRPPAAPDDAAFDRGVGVARSPQARAGILSTMFSARTLGLVGALAGEAQADYLSGLLIGSEIAGLEQIAAPLGDIILAGSDELCRRYRRALAGHGHAAAAIAPHATERGLWRIARAAGLVAGGPP